MKLPAIVRRSRWFTLIELYARRAQARVAEGFTLIELYARRAQARVAEGFTLIELIVVIAILGVLSAVLIATIDPLDKINSASDAGVISTITQIGRANDYYATANNGNYVTGASFGAALAALNAAGETKISSYAPSGYTITGNSSVGAFYFASTLRSKKYTGKIFIYNNGQGCTKATGGATCP